MATGWHRLIPRPDAFRGPGKYRIDAYSEFLPPPASDGSRTATIARTVPALDPADPFGWQVTRIRGRTPTEAGPVQVAKQVLGKLSPPPGRKPGHRAAAPPPGERLSVLAAGTGRRAKGAARAVRAPVAAGPVAHPGRQGPRPLDAVRQQRAGPRQAFWKSFFTAPGSKGRRTRGSASSAGCCKPSTAKKVAGADGLRRAGFRILPDDDRNSRLGRAAAGLGRARSCWPSDAGSAA